MYDSDVIVIGSGIGGLTAAALLSRYGKRVIVCESHAIAGGAAHSFSRRGFTFDSGPSFYSGLIDPRSRNPLRQVLEVLAEVLPAIPYNPMGHYHFPEGTFPVYSQQERYLEAANQITPSGARELERFIHAIRCFTRDSYISFESRLATSSRFTEKLFTITGKNAASSGYYPSFSRTSYGSGSTRSLGATTD